MKIISSRQAKSRELKACYLHNVLVLSNKLSIPRKLKKKLCGTKKNRKMLEFKTSYEAFSFSDKMSKYRKRKYELRQFVYGNNNLGIEYKN